MEGQETTLEQLFMTTKSDLAGSMHRHLPHTLHQWVASFENTAAADWKLALNTTHMGEAVHQMVLDKDLRALTGLALAAGGDRAVLDDASDVLTALSAARPELVETWWAGLSLLVQCIVYDQ